MSEYLADEGLLHELLDLRRGLDRLLNRLDKNLPVGEVARQMDERLCEIIPAVRIPCLSVGRRRPAGI